MWKKDETQDTDMTAQRPTEPRPAPRSEAAKPGAAGDRANIGRSITVKGDISGAEDLSIQGTVDGSVMLKEHNVTISSEGKVKADIHGRTITVQGHVEGDLFGVEQVILSPSCRVRGNITAPRVALEDGANFRGTIDMEAKPGAGAAAMPQQSSADQPAPMKPPVALTTEPSNVAKAETKKP